MFDMDKWALCGHFYSYVDPVWSLYSIGPCCHVVVQDVFLVEPPWKPFQETIEWNFGLDIEGLFTCTKYPRTLLSPGIP